MNDLLEKEIRESETIVKELVERDEIITRLPETDSQKFVGFYLKQSEVALRTAALLFEISTNEEEKRHHKLQPDFETLLWAINSAYYSMFYAVNALLAGKGIKIKSEQGVHRKVAHAFVYFFIRSDLLARKLFDEFSKAQQEASELLGFEEFEKKAKMLSKDLDYERKKRRTFTYETTDSIKQTTAQTSLVRARNFFETIKSLLR